MALGTLALRLAVGGLITGHGLQKLRGAFGGPGMEGTIGMTKALGLHPAELNARAIAWSETAGGAAIALGVLTPIASAGVIAGQAVAIRKVHLRNGVWASNGGVEYNLVLIAAAFAAALDGPGPVSFDALVGRSRWGAVPGLLALLGGVAASFAVTEAGARLAPPEAGPADAPTAQDAASPSAGAEPVGDGAPAVPEGGDSAGSADAEI